MNAKLCGSENIFATITNFYRLVNILWMKISHIINLNYRSTISTPMEEVNNKVQCLHYEFV